MDISIALIWFGDVADISITEPPSAFTSGAYSLSGSMIIISASDASIRFVISFLAVNDLPEPDTPRMNELPFRSFLLSAIIMFFEMTF